MVVSPLSFPYSLRRKRKESFRIQFGESDTSISASEDGVIDDVFCSVDEGKQLDKYCASRKHVTLWIIGGAILFVLPIIVLPSIMSAQRSDLRASATEASPQTMTEKADLPQVSLIEKIRDTTSPAPTLLFPKDLSPYHPPTASPSMEDSMATSSLSASYSSAPTVDAPSQNTGTPTSDLMPSASNVILRTSSAPSFAATPSQTGNSSALVPDSTSVPSTARPSSDFQPTRAPIPSPQDKDESPSVANETQTKPTATLQLPSLSSIVIPIEVPISTPVAVPAPVVIPQTTLRINCGGDQLVFSTPFGQQFWIPDRFFTSSGTLWTNTTCDDPSGTERGDGDMLYCTARENVESYNIHVTKGDYAVSFHLILLGSTSDKDTPQTVTIFGTPVIVTEPRQTVVLKTRVDTQMLHIPIVSSTTSNDALRILLAAIEIEPDSDALVRPVPDVLVEAAAESVLATPVPAAAVTPLESNATYSPGDLVVSHQGLLLSRGLTARAIATSGHSMLYRNGTASQDKFHRFPDAGATYPDPRTDTNDGGWIYVSNSEVKPTNEERYPGGVGAITFDREGLMIDYRMVLTNTRMNCGGGRTPWGTWISGEEYADTGHIWQVDPTGERNAERITMGETHSGLFESFAYDVRNRQQPRFFMTQDHKSGALRRFSPDNPDWHDPWNILLGNGTLEYLVVEPSAEESNAGNFHWTTNFTEGADAAFQHFQNTEGIDVINHHLYFVSKTLRTIFILDLDVGTYVNETTRNGLFNGQPDQIERIDESRPASDQELVYFTEDGGRLAGVHARNTKGQYLTVLESSEYSDETTGLSFSSDGKHMYVAYQENGLLFDVTREDGLSFHAETLDIKFHAAGE